MRVCGEQKKNIPCIVFLTSVGPCNKIKKEVIRVNKQRRVNLSQALTHLKAAMEIVNDVKRDEEDAMNNMPENLQESERYYTLEENVEALDAIADSIDEVCDTIDESL